MSTHKVNSTNYYFLLEVNKNNYFIDNCRSLWTNLLNLIPRSYKTVILRHLIVTPSKVIEFCNWIKSFKSFFQKLGNAENSSISDELERAPIDAFKEKKVTFEENPHVFGEEKKQGENWKTSFVSWSLSFWLLLTFGSSLFVSVCVSHFWLYLWFPLFFLCRCICFFLCPFSYLTVLFVNLFMCHWMN